ncbi:condensation domain-containing protein [Kitasatospora sp. NBC_00315]|uniref:condensation domain-containing protein n=1 Tax=Kitasatospora sp. NBC_00315 TaxID=2975963 RepID=UPI00324C4602
MNRPSSDTAPSDTAPSNTVLPNTAPPDSVLPITFGQDGEPVTAVMTWGQVAIWDVLRWLPPEDTSTNLLLSVPAPPGTGVERAVRAVRLLVERHDSLRTLFSEAPEGPCQQVLPGGTLQGWRCPADAAGAEHAAAEAGARLRATPFAADELPVRAAVVTEGPHAALVVLCLSHLAIDGWSLSIVRADLAQLLADPPQLPPRAQQPLERARYEASEPARRGQARALRFWEDALRELPPAMVEDLREGGGSDRQWSRISSPALALAAAEHARRTRLSSSVVLQAATLLLLALHTGEPSAALRTIVATRFRPENQALVGAFNQNALVRAELREEPFEAFLRRVGSAAANGYRHTEYEPRALERLIERVGTERGLRTGGFCFFNDVRFGTGHQPLGSAAPGSAEALTAALARTELSDPQWDFDQKGSKFFLFLQELDAAPEPAGARAVVTLCADRRFLAGRGSSVFLEDLEWLLARTAYTDTTTGELAAALCGRAPVPG